MTQRISKYCLVYGANTNTLVEKVNGLIAEGWQPQGGVSGPVDLVYGSTHKASIMQAMVLVGDADT